MAAYGEGRSYRTGSAWTVIRTLLHRAPGDSVPSWTAAATMIKITKADSF